MNELHMLEQQKGFSQELNKAKTKLFYFSLIIIFVVVFEPSMTGLLGAFSIKVHSYPSLFTLALIIILLWFFTRYLVILANEYPQIDFINKPLMAAKQISTIWGDSHQSLENTKKELSGITDNLTKHNIHLNNIIISEYLESKCTIEQTSGETSKEKEVQSKICDNLRRFNYLHDNLPELHAKKLMLDV